MIEIRNSGRFAVPVVVCDYCRRPIEDFRTGNALWNWEDRSPVFHAHKQCDPGDLPWAPLKEHIYYLTKNIGLTPKLLKSAGEFADETNAMLSGIGKGRKHGRKD